MIELNWFQKILVYHPVSLTLGIVILVLLFMFIVAIKTNRPMVSLVIPVIVILLLVHVSATMPSLVAYRKYSVEKYTLLESRDYVNVYAKGLKEPVRVPKKNIAYTTTTKKTSGELQVAYSRAKGLSFEEARNFETDDFTLNSKIDKYKLIIYRHEKTKTIDFKN